MQKKRFPVVPERVAKSPLKTVARVRETLEKYKKGEPIGFTFTSSLKSMGLVPRSNGMYELGDKYKPPVLYAK